MPRLPRGLRFGANMEVLNDFQELWYPESRVDSDTIFPLYTFKGNMGGSFFDTYGTNNIVRQVRRTPHRATVPIASSGLRPCTSVWYDPSSLLFRIPEMRAVWDNGMGDTGDIVYNDFLFNTPAPKEFDFSNSLAPRYSNAFSAFNAKYGVIIGEGRETLKYFALLLRRLHKAVRAVRHGDLRGLRRILDSYHKGHWKPATAGNLWLEFRYGLVPLFHDIKDVMNDWTRINDKIQKYRRFSVGHGEDFKLSIDGLYPGLTHFRLSGEITVQRRHRWGIVYANREGYATFDNGSIRPVSDWKELANAFINPGEVAWELTPYSFVVDWFINVGDIIEQQKQLYQNIDIVDGYQRRDIRMRSVTLKGVRNGIPVRVTGSVELVDSFYNRSHTTRIPQATLELDTSFSSIKHVLDSISLITQRIKR
uniref:A-protein n=1 Tax=Enterobacteria phage M11 TaxID=74336 RepID=O64302_BPQBE|nr:A-protein [Enterobacteria phage M11]